jgi:MFS transporter, SP family, general alpha glucoside:H+ symporter
VLARSTYYVGNIICGGLIQPKLLAPGAWNAKGKTVSLLASYLRVTANLYRLSSGQRWPL